MTFPYYDELHVISDLHMGGASADFQILRETRRLAAYVRWVAAQRPGERVALLLNGDIVDTLAEEVDGYIAVDSAADTMRRIMDKDPSFTLVWDALAAFVRTPNRTLVLVIGNHDIELAFPLVLRLIVARLAGEDTAAMARIEFATAGAGFACLVGNARIFCTHGNEVDAWNYVRYEDLSRVARRLNAGRPLTASEWEPNAGSKMVKDVMNEVKRRYAWIDLLKPETKAAVGVLLVVDPAQAAKLHRLLDRRRAPPRRGRVRGPPRRRRVRGAGSGRRRPAERRSHAGAEPARGPGPGSRGPGNVGPHAAGGREELWGRPPEGRGAGRPNPRNPPARMGPAHGVAHRRQQARGPAPGPLRLAGGRQHVRGRDPG
jgi:hypothetical protein